MSNPPSWLPEPLNYDDFGGKWDKFLTSVYGIFERDFKYSRPIFKEHPIIYNSTLVAGKEEAFWHITSSSDIVTGNREPNMRRCERIGWIKSIIEHANDEYVKMWENKRGSSIHILLWLEELDYMVILRERRNRAVLLSAIYVDQNRRRRNLRKEWEQWTKSQKPP